MNQSDETSRAAGTVSAGTTPPLPTRPAAFFIDFDGTLVEIVSNPADVFVEPSLRTLLTRLLDVTDGAVAVISGRPISFLEERLGIEGLNYAGIHGLEIGLADGTRDTIAVDEMAIDAAEALFNDFAARNAGIIVERKWGAVALHFRQRPDLAGRCDELAAEAVALSSALERLAGKSVYELKAGKSDKGRAVERLMATPRFAGRMPVYLGDDVTDEDGFAAMSRLGGIGIKVGQGTTHAEFRLAAVADVHRWLRDATLGWSASGP